MTKPLLDKRAVGAAVGKAVADSKEGQRRNPIWKDRSQNEWGRTVTTRAIYDEMAHFVKNPRLAGVVLMAVEHQDSGYEKRNPPAGRFCQLTAIRILEEFGVIKIEKIHGPPQMDTRYDEVKGEFYKSPSCTPPRLERVDVTADPAKAQEMLVRCKEKFVPAGARTP